MKGQGTTSVENVCIQLSKLQNCQIKMSFSHYFCHPLPPLTLEAKLQLNWHKKTSALNFAIYLIQPLASPWVIHIIAIICSSKILNTPIVTLLPPTNPKTIFLMLISVIFTSFLSDTSFTPVPWDILHPLCLFLDSK